MGSKARHAAFASVPSTNEVRKILPVPFIWQQKDTSLLSLEAEEGGPNPWDRPWQGHPGDRGRAVVAMITAFFHGALSQDRIGYEAHWDRNEGPQHDIDVSAGFWDRDFERVLTFALVPRRPNGSMQRRILTALTWPTRIGN